MTTFYQIGEVCQRTGLTQRTLHYYDEIGILVPTERLTGGQRLYSAGDLERIERIKNLKQLLGLSLSEIKRMLDADEARDRYLSAAQTDADPARRNKAVESALRVTEDQLQSVRGKVQQLGRLQRQLERQVRELRRLTLPAGSPEVPMGIGGRS
ncbi:MAG TPA: MerR family transcriptional regulator [bacterium]|nr:MerR family transcriptional regulator [bacterium]